MTYAAEPARYESKMRYRRAGRSGLDLPSLSLGYWHNFELQTQRRRPSSVSLRPEEQAEGRPLVARRVGVGPHAH